MSRKVILSVIILIIISIVFIIPSDMDKIKAIGFKEHKQNSPLKVYTAITDSMDKAMAGVYGQEYRNDMRLENGAFLETGDKIRVTTNNGKKDVSMDFEFLGYFPYKQELYVTKSIRGKSKIFKIPLEQANLQIENIL